MIGAQISDDCYLHFDVIDIETLEKSGIVLGKFYLYDNKLPQRKLSFEFITVTTEAVVTTTFDINFNKKVVLLKLSKSDFNDWLFFPDQATLEKGPSIRFASTNVYVSQKGSLCPYKQYIEAFASM